METYNIFEFYIFLQKGDIKSAGDMVIKYKMSLSEANWYIDKDIKIETWLAVADYVSGYYFDLYR